MALGLNLCMVLLAGCGGSSGTSSGGSSGPPAQSTPYIYLATIGASGAPTILSYPINPAGASVSAVSTLTGPAGSTFVQIRSDGAGHLYSLAASVSNSQGVATVTEYTASKGVLTSIRSFSFNPEEETEAVALTADSAGNVYVFQDGTGTIYKFGPTASGAATPVATLAADTRNVDAMVLDASGNLYCLEPDKQAIAVYTANTTKGVPLKSIPLGNYLNASETDLVMDSAGNLYVSGTNFPTNIGIDETAALLEFDAGTTGAPTKMITGGATLLKEPTSIALIQPGTLYVYDSAAAKAFSEFTFTYQENLAPTSGFSITDFNGAESTASIAID